jgi:hypothetical protein
MVVAGSIILLIALALYAGGLRRAARDAGPLGRAYYVLVGCLFAACWLAPSSRRHFLANEHHEEYASLRALVEKASPMARSSAGGTGVGHLGSAQGIGLSQNPRRARGLAQAR